MSEEVWRQDHLIGSGTDLAMCLRPQDRGHCKATGRARGVLGALPLPRFADVLCADLCCEVVHPPGSSPGRLRLDSVCYRSQTSGTAPVVDQLALSTHSS